MRACSTVTETRRIVVGVVANTGLVERSGHDSWFSRIVDQVETWCAFH